MKVLIGLLLFACFGVGSAAAQSSTTIVTRSGSMSVYAHSSPYGSSTRIVTHPSWRSTTVTNTYQGNTRGRYQPMGSGGYRPMGR